MILHCYRFLPSGYPSTVHKSYLPFCIWTGIEQFIANITTVLATSSMLYSVGVISTTTTAVASTVQWIIKDGIADSGKLIFNRLYSHTFDVYPKSWKMCGELLIGLGFAFQLATAAGGPEYFLLLAASGSLLKGLSYLIWGTSHGLFTRYMSQSHNFADVSAKNESQQVISNLLGMSTGLVILQSLQYFGLGSSVTALFGVFSILFPMHLYATYKACKSIELELLSQGRVIRLLHTFVTNVSLPNVVFTVMNKKYTTPTKQANHITMPNIQYMTNTETYFDEHNKLSKYDWFDMCIGVSLSTAFNTQQSLLNAIQRYQDEYYMISIDRIVNNTDRTNKTTKPYVYICLHHDASHYEKLKSMLNGTYVSKLLAAYQQQHNHVNLTIHEQTKLLDQAYKLTTATYSIFQTCLVRSQWSVDTVIISDNGVRCNWYSVDNTVHDYDSSNQIDQPDTTDTNSDSDTSNIV